MLKYQKINSIGILYNYCTCLFFINHMFVITTRVYTPSIIPFNNPVFTCNSAHNNQIFLWYRSEADISVLLAGHHSGPGYEGRYASVPWSTFSTIITFIRLLNYTLNWTFKIRFPWLLRGLTNISPTLDPLIKFSWVNNSAYPLYASSDIENRHITRKMFLKIQTLFKVLIQRANSISFNNKFASRFLQCI